MVQSVFLILIRWLVIYPMDSAIQRLNNRGLINLDPLDRAIGFSLIFIHFVVIYPMDSAIQLLNNCGA